MPKSSQTTRKRTTAQAMVEFALALPILLLVVYGLLETGRLLFMYASVVTAARQAARYGSATGDNGAGVKYYDDCAGIEASARQLQFIQRFDNISITFDNPNPDYPWGPVSCPIPHPSPNDPNLGHPANGDRIRVSVTTNFSPIVPLVPLKAFAITSTSNRTLLVGSYIEVAHPGEGFTGSGTTGFVLTKWANTDYYRNIGDTITYHYTIQNTGTVPIDGPFWVKDNRISTTNQKGFPCTGAPSPLPGPSGVITCPDQVYTITAADITTPEVTNHARASNDALSIYSNEAVYTVSFVPAPHITLTKSGTLQGNVVDSGSIVGYTFTILNDGNVPLKPPYTISDSLLGKNWSCPSTPDPLAVGTTVVCTGQYTLKSSDISASILTNTASASAMSGTTTVTSASVTVHTPVPLLQLTSVSITTSTGDAITTYTTLGESLRFTFHYSNRGTKTLSGLGLVAGGTLKAGTITCPSQVAANSTGQCTIDYVVTQADLDAGTILDTVTVHGTQSSPSTTWTSNALSVSIQGNQVGAVTITMVPSPDKPGGISFSLGQPINYTFTFQNSGNLTLKGPYTIQVTDAQVPSRIPPFVCSGPATLPVGAPVEAVTCPIKSLNLDQADLDAGRLVTTATGTALPSVGTTSVTPGTATAVVVTYTGPRISLSKIPNKTAFVAAGDTIVYSYGLKNTGGQVVTVTPFTLYDDKLKTISCPAGTIAVGETLSCGALQYTTTSLDVAALLVQNTLTVDASNTGAGVGDGAAPATVAGIPPVVVPLLKCDPSTLSASAISDGSNVDWYITNKTGVELHITGGWMRWNNPVILLGIMMAGQPVNATGASVLLLPSSGWQPVPYSLTDTTHLILKFSGTASGIQVYLTFQESFGGLGCTLQSTQLTLP